ncbi:MAG: DUF4276 family protein [Phycisphaerales bacterium]|nr:DUF4276 family protein [Phycisphaerales bacterium]
MFEIAPIVEGYGDVEAVPILIRNLAPELVVRRPVRFPKTKLLKRDQLERAVAIAASNIRDRGAVLLMVDADSECAIKLARGLESECAAAHSNVVCRIAIPVREFESWIVGGCFEFQDEDVDRAGDPKGRLRKVLGDYSETADQARLAAKINPGVLAPRSRSFRHLLDVIGDYRRLANSAS